jgi:hypothetical protein
VDARKTARRIVAEWRPCAPTEASRPGGRRRSIFAVSGCCRLARNSDTDRVCERLVCWACKGSAKGVRVSDSISPATSQPFAALPRRHFYFESDERPK